MKKRNISLVPALLFVALSAPAMAGPAASGATNAPFWTGMTDAATFERAMDARLAHARTLLDRK